MRSSIVLVAALLAACDDPFAAEEVRLYRAVATGGEHTCAVSLDDAVYCWGRGFEGQLGNGDTANRTTPFRVSAGPAFTDVGAGATHTCALAVDRTIYCWGNSSTTPAQLVAGNARFIRLSAGDRHTCALSTDSIAYCWGENAGGQLGDGTTSAHTQPLPVNTAVRFVYVTAGAGHTCAVTATGAGYCWGRNELGQLGIGSVSASVSVPTAVQGSIEFIQIDAGTTHTCGVARDTRIYCWGGNEFGELGIGGSTPAGVPGATSPVPISPFSPTGVSVAAGEHHTCAILPNSLGRCWGRGTFGQLGNGLVETHFHPQPIHLQPTVSHANDLLHITSFGVGGKKHVCSLVEERVYCWGTGDQGQLGLQNSRFTTMPQRVAD